MVLFQKQNGLSQCLAAGRTERIVKLRKDLLGSVPFDGLWLETRVGGFSYVYIIIYILYLHVYNNCKYRYINIWTNKKKKRPLWGLYFDM